MKRAAIVAGAAAAGIWIAAGAGCGPFEYEEWPARGSGGGSDGGAAGAGGIVASASSGVAQLCTPGTVRACYSGPAEKAGLGACDLGTERCNMDGSGFGPCMNDVQPRDTELCGNSIDDDCDGRVDQPQACLSSRGLLVRYFINESESGQPGVKLADHGPAPAEDMPVKYTDNFFFWTDEGGHRALRRRSTSDDGFAGMQISGSSKIRALDGSTTGTIEIVAAVEALDDNARLSHLGVRDNCGDFTLKIRQSSQIEFCMDDQTKSIFDLDIVAEGRAVIHLVFDAANSAAPSRLFVDGNPIQATTSSEHPAAITLPGDTWHSLGSRPDEILQFMGNLYYSALYSVVLSDEEIKNHAISLGYDDDALQTTTPSSSAR